MRRPGVSLAAGLLASALAAGTALAAPKSKKPDKMDGVALAKEGDCVAAVPLLEQSEAKAHRPESASLLATCHVALGELLLAHEIFQALADERPDPSWTKADRLAHAKAQEEADELSARLPRVRLRIEPKEAVVRVVAAGRPIKQPREEFRIPPDEQVEIAIEADDFAPHTESLVLREGATKTLTVTLKRIGKAPPPPKPKPPEGPSVWLGAEFRGFLIPTFVMNVVGEGGTTAYLPGAAVTVVARSGDVDLKTSVAVTSYGLGTTPFKPHDTPDTEWELVESSLVGLTAALDVMYVVPLVERERVAFKFGAGLGIGVMVAGDLLRWQSYPEDGEEGDPAAYAKCKGPNDPPGTFRYCNQLDKDADRYGNPDRVWGDGGAQPVVYPYLSLPQLGFAFRPVDPLTIDVELGVTLQGLMTATGVRYGF